MVQFSTGSGRRLLNAGPLAGNLILTQVIAARLVGNAGSSVVLKGLAISALDTTDWLF